jgi:uncharacterized protein (TIGR02145 family)
MKAKIKNQIFPVLVLGVIILLSNACKKDTNYPDSVKDADGNVYHTVKIGVQVWMVENLKTTKYRNGDPILNVTDSIQWINLTSGAFCSYNNNSKLASVYGQLYNWYAVNDSRNLAPAGWHVATNDDWDLLVNNYGGLDLAGGKLKEAGTTHWVPPNTESTNESGFTALPSGYRYSDGGFFNLGYYSPWWSSTIYLNDYGWNWGVGSYNTYIYKGVDLKVLGIAVRCVMD